MQGGMMGYGGMRGGGGMRHQQPQPQRHNQNRRNNRFRGGGGGRFDNRNNQQNNQNQNNRPNKELMNMKTEPPKPKIDTVDAPAKVPAPAPQQTQPPAQNTVNKPVQSTPPNKPQNVQQTQQKQQPQQKPQPQQPQQKPQPQQTQQKQPQQLQQKQQPQQPQQKQQQQQQNVQQNKPQHVNQPINNQNDIKNMPKSLNSSNTNLNNVGNQQNNVNKNQQQQQNQPNSGFKANSNQQGGDKGNFRRYQGQDREEHFMVSKLKDIAGSTLDLPQLDQTEQKFSGRNRLYIGNLSNDITEQDILDIFNPYGETSELFLNKAKNFAFIRIDYKANADKAKREVDGRMRRGRPLRVRFAPHNAAIKVKNLTPFVSNELLYKAFEVFGKIERAIVKVDDRGKSLGEGIVEFVRRAGAMAAIRHCTERCFFLTSSLKPVVVESLEEVDEVDGYTEKTLPRKNQDYCRAREVGPRFAEAGSFEHEYGTRWKQLFELYKQKEEALHREKHMEEDKLEAQMEFAKYEHETELLREKLRQREQDRDRQKRSWEMTERQVDEQREKERETLIRQQDDMAQRMRIQEDELRRRQQENTLFMQAQQLNRILDVQEQSIGGNRDYDSQMQDKRGFDGSMSNMGGSMQMDTPYMEHYDQMCGHMGYDDGMSRWDSRQEDYPNKRRRY